MIRNLKGLLSKNAPLLGDRRIHLHLGAHKTATTFIQKMLADCQDNLLDQGVLYVPLKQIRTGFTRHLVGLCSAGRNPEELAIHRKRLLKMLDPERLEKCHTVLISDENLLGRAGGGCAPNRIRENAGYDSVAGNWKHIHAELGPNVSAFYSIRDYPGFLSSMYSEIFRKSPSIPFRKVRTFFENSPSLWTLVHNDLCTAFGPANVTMWDFKDTTTHPELVRSMLAGIELSNPVNPVPVRASLSNSAMTFVRDFQKLPGKPLPPAVLVEVGRRLYPLSKFPTKFDPWKPEERAALQELYQQEKNTLPMRRFPASTGLG